MHVDYNYKYDSIVDPYTYPGTAILREALQNPHL